MPLAAVIMVLVSCVSHAYWNLLAKQARDKLVFAWLLYATGGVVMIPLAFWGARVEPIQPAMWWCALGTSLAFTAYSVLLARSYRHGDVSLVYPLIRSTGPLLTVVVAHIFLHERLSPFGYVGVLLIVLGAAGISWPRREPATDGAALHARRRQMASILPAILTGATVAIFSSIDKRGSTLASPMFYNFTLFWGTVLCMAPLVLRRRSWEQVVTEVRVDWRPLWVTGILNVFGYLLVLYSMRVAAASYVIALRSTAVVFAVFLGSRVLGEKRGLERGLLGVLIIAGLALVYLKG